MATLYVEQYNRIVEDTKGNQAQVPGVPLGTEPSLKVTVGATSARTSSDFETEAKFLILAADVDCQFEVGDSTVTADTNSRILLANTYREVEVRESDTRIAVIEKQ